MKSAEALIAGKQSIDIGTTCSFESHVHDIRARGTYHIERTIQSPAPKTADSCRAAPTLQQYVRRYSSSPKTLRR